VFETLARAPYVSLATFRKSGVAVATPVWCAAASSALYVFSAADAGKVKRLRNEARARLAPCNVRGKRLGDWVDAQAHIVTDPESIGIALDALRRKYGWQMRMVDWGAKLSGRFDQRTYIRVTPSTSARLG
jgi:PPOX class probable F420-dependent enzyme